MEPENTNTMAQRLEAVLKEDGFVLDHTMENWSGKDQMAFADIAANPVKYVYEASFDNLQAADPALQFLFDLAGRFVERLMQSEDLETAQEQTTARFEDDELENFCEQVPFVPGAHHITPHWLHWFFSSMQQVFAQDVKSSGLDVRAYFFAKNPELQMPEKLCFHLVENKQDESYPFAFLITYARKDENGRVHHIPLAHSLEEFADDRQKLLSLLSSLNKAAEISPLIESFMISGELMHPLKLTAKEAYEFLQASAKLMEAGIVCRIPNWWKRSYSTISLSLNSGAKKQSLFGLDSLISLKPALMVQGKALSKAEIKALLKAEEGLVQIHGSWVEVSHDKLEALLQEMEDCKDEASLLEVLRAQAGIGQSDEGKDGPVVRNGAWLSSLMKKLQDPKAAPASSIPKSVHAKLRPYQKQGVQWLKTLEDYGLGACLADDMGLGKTLQVLTYLEMLRQKDPSQKILLVVPASLLGNWKEEAAKFTPDLPLNILHGKKASQLEEELDDPAYLTITTYGMAARLEGLKARKWDLVVLDEAQAIKNPKTKQTRTIKSIPAKSRIALTGTPVENSLINLWSIFDFTNPGLLGSQSEFGKYIKSLEKHPGQYGPLRRMIAPFLLRRMKTDKRIVSDLPKKVEIRDVIELSARQKVLYNREIQALEKGMKEKTEGIERKGMVLASLTRLKQICDHPDLFSGLGEFDPKDSGKYEMLAQIVEPIKENRECMLVFTQYRSMTEELDVCLSRLFGRKGLVINGSTPVKTRSEYARAFNEQNTWIPYMVLSLKAAGTGLNLTAANHVVHFDRWWNPAAENQATDRAFRIGQKKNVMVHQFVCEGTLEEKIDQLMKSKQTMADELIGPSEEGAEKMLTEMSNEELLDLVRLEVN